MANVNMFDGRDDLRVIPSVVPHFVLARLVALSQGPVRDVHVALFPASEPGMHCRILSHPRPVVVSPAYPIVVPIAYETDRGCHCAVVVNFLAEDGDLLQCRGDVSLLPSVGTGRELEKAWQGARADLPKRAITIGRPLPGMDVINALAKGFGVVFHPLRFDSATSSPIFAWGSVDPVIFARFAPPSSLTVFASPDVDLTGVEGILAGGKDAGQVSKSLIKVAFEAGRLVEHAQVLLDMNWHVPDFLDVVCTLKGLLLQIGVPSPFGPVEALLQGKSSIGELSQGDRDAIQAAIRDIRWVVAGQVA